MFSHQILLVQLMAWCWTGDMQLPELMMTEVDDAFMGDRASIC